MRVRVTSHSRLAPDSSLCGNSQVPEAEPSLRTAVDFSLSTPTRANPAQRRARAVEPAEHLLKSGPEVRERRQWSWELVAEHVVPFSLDLLSKPGCQHGFQRRHIDSSVCALLPQHCRDGRCSSDEVGVPVKVDDVVEVAGTASFGECSQFLTEEFGDRI
jgi:hypothetical protein